MPEDTLPEDTLIYPKVFGLPVWFKSTQWHETMCDPQTTQPSVLQLIERVATKHGRWQRLCEIDERCEHPKVTFTIQDDHVLDAQLTLQGTRANTLSWAIHGAMREYKRQNGALHIAKRDVELGDGRRKRRIVLRRDERRLPIAKQLANLQTALTSKSDYAIEQAYWGLTPPTLKIVKSSIALAGSRGLLATYGATGIVMARLQTQQMHDPEFLRSILPVARELAPKPGKHTVRPRDELLRVIFDAYRAASGSETVAAFSGLSDAPAGPGADFVFEIGRIFGVTVMPGGSKSAIRRALRM